MGFKSYCINKFVKKEKKCSLTSNENIPFAK